MPAAEGAGGQTAVGDDDALADGLARWLADRRGLADPTVGDLRRPSAGYSSETVFAEVEWTADDGPHQATMVIRMAPAQVGTFRHYDLVVQGQAQRTAAAAGVPVAAPEVETDTRWLGAPFMVMPRVEGHIIGAVAHLDRWLAGLDPTGQGRVYDNFVATLTAVHRADARSAPDVPRRDNTAELDHWEEYLEWSSGGSPVRALADGLAWCRRHKPIDEPAPALLWGDARFENMVLGDDLSPRAVLDWDMTAVGAPEHDLAWFTSLDLTMHQLFGQPQAGFPGRQETVARFEAHSGRPVQDLEWYETLAMVRSSAVMTRIGYLRRQAGLPLLLPIDDNPVLDVLLGRLR